MFIRYKECPALPGKIEATFDMFSIEIDRLPHLRRKSGSRPQYISVLTDPQLLKLIPKRLVQETDPKKIQTSIQILSWWQQMSKKEEVELITFNYLKSFVDLDFFKRRVESHVETIKVTDLGLHQFLEELWIFFAFCYYIFSCVSWVRQHGLTKHLDIPK